MSITWTDRPDRGDGPSNFRLLRVGRNGRVRGIIISPNIVGTGLHYWRGKSVPCGNSKCEACADGHTPRWYGYLALWNRSSDSIAIAEITDGCADDIDRYRARHGSLRGADLLLTRQGNRPNGRILADVNPQELAEERLPQAPDVIKIMMKIWGANENHAVATRASRVPPIGPSKAAREPSDNGSSKQHL